MPYKPSRRRYFDAYIPYDFFVNTLLEDKYKDTYFPFRNVETGDIRVKITYYPVEALPYDGEVIQVNIKVPELDNRDFRTIYHRICLVNESCDEWKAIASGFP